MRFDLYLHALSELPISLELCRQLKTFEPPRRSRGAMMAESSDIEETGSGATRSVTVKDTVRASTATTRRLRLIVERSQ